MKNPGADRPEMQSQGEQAGRVAGSWVRNDLPGHDTGPPNMAPPPWLFDSAHRNLLERGMLVKWPRDLRLVCQASTFFQMAFTPEEGHRPMVEESAWDWEAGNPHSGPSSAVVTWGRRSLDLTNVPFSF